MQIHITAEVSIKLQKVIRIKTRNLVSWILILLAVDSQWGLVLALRKAPLNTGCCTECMSRSDSELAYGPWTGRKTLEFSLPSTLHGCCCLGPKNRIDVVAEMFLFTSAIMRETEPPREIQIRKSPLQQMIISVGWHLWRHFLSWDNSVSFPIFMLYRKSFFCVIRKYF